MRRVFYCAAVLLLASAGALRLQQTEGEEKDADHLAQAEAKSEADSQFLPFLAAAAPYLMDAAVAVAPMVSNFFNKDADDGKSGGAPASMDAVGRDSGGAPARGSCSGGQNSNVVVID